MSVLVVDDSPDSRLLLKKILESSGYQVRLAVSARDAFDQLGGDDDSSRGGDTDLVLMDNIMPEMTGIEACSMLKAHEGLRDIPIIMVTGRSEVEDLQLAFAAGAMDYITKPPNKAELLARVRSALRLKHEMDRRRAREQELIELTRQLEDANRTLQRISSLDGLTGITNRRGFDEFLEREWRRGQREALPLSLVLLDIDFFKAYNDTYGHQSGDDCLRDVAQALGTSMNRATDLAARYGGEEFAIVLPGTDTEGAYSVAEAMRERIEELRIPHEASQVTDYVTISLGVATVIPNRFSSPSSLIASADRGLYGAKKAGRNRVGVCEVESELAGVGDGNSEPAGSR